MQDKIHKTARTKKGEVASQDLLKGSTAKGKGEVITIERSEKIEVEIREIIRIYPADFEALKNSFEEWAESWQ